MKSKNNTSKFNSDLDWGRHWEFETISFIENSFNEVLKKDGKILRFIQENISTNKNELKKYDMKYGVYDIGSPYLKKEIFFEIKADKFEETGNLIFEKSCSKKASGVFSTEADYFVYILPRYSRHNFYLVKPKDLIELLSTKYSQCLIYGGDGNRALNYLVTKSEFDEDFIKIGKLYDYDAKIPEKFNIDKFKVKNNYVYQSDYLKCYENPLE